MFIEIPSLLLLSRCEKIPLGFTLAARRYHFFCVDVIEIEMKESKPMTDLISQLQPKESSGCWVCCNISS
jgi:hypothetical protein